MPVIGAAVVSLPWAIAQFGWVAGPVIMFFFSFVKYYSSTLLADHCYLSGADPDTGERNYTYMDAVQASMAGMQLRMIYHFVQYLSVLGDAIGSTTAASISMIAIKRANCFHERGHQNPCDASGNPYMIVFGVFQILFSQLIPDSSDQIRWLSIIAAVMSFTYSSIGLGLGIAQTIGKASACRCSWLFVSANGRIRGSLTGVRTTNGVGWVWRSFQAFGNIAFAYSFSNAITAGIQDTMRTPPLESKTIKKAILISVVVTTTFYMLFGCIGYAAFGDLAPDNLLTGFGFYDPFWLLDIANVALVVRHVCTYQVYCHDLFAFVEKRAQQWWPDVDFVTKKYRLHLLPLPRGSGPFYSLNLFRLLWRAAFVVLTTIISMLLPVFDDVAGFFSALGFWPLTVYYPMKMYVNQKKIPNWSSLWVCLQLLSVACLIVSMAVAAGSMVSTVVRLQNYKPFKTMQY